VTQVQQGTDNMTDPIEGAARKIADALHELEPDAQQAYRYLYARVALDAGLLVLIGQEVRPTGIRLVCQEPNSGAFYQVDQPASWTDEEEAEYVSKMRKNLLGDSDDMDFYRR
jgi:hypothetical protein